MTLYTVSPPPLFMGWVFSILVMGSWDSIILALCSRLRSCTIEGLRSLKKLQICYINVYLIRILLNFVVFWMLLWILQDFLDLLEFRGSTTTQNIRIPENPLQRCISSAVYRILKYNTLDHAVFSWGSCPNSLLLSRPKVSDFFTL